MITLTILSAVLSLASTADVQDVKAEAPQSDALKMVMYDITDLARTKRTDIDEASIPDRPRTPGSGGKVDMELEARRAEEYAALTDVVFRHCRPPLDPGQPRITHAPRGLIVVQGNAAQHAWISAFLHRQLEEELTLYTSEVRIVTLPPKGLAELALGKLPVILDEKRTDELLKRLQARDDTELIAAPVVSAFGRRKTIVSVTEQTAYVSRYEKYENVAPKGHTIIDPIIEVLRSGLTITARATGVDDELIDLDLQVELVEIAEMRTVETELGEVMVPEVVRRDFQTGLALEPGSTAVYSGLGTDDETAIILVRVKAVEPAKHEDDAPRPKRSR